MPARKAKKASAKLRKPKSLGSVKPLRQTLHDDESPKE